MQLLQSHEIESVSGGDFTIGTSSGTITVWQQDMGDGYEEQIWNYPNGTMAIKIVKTTNIA